MKFTSISNREVVAMAVVFTALLGGCSQPATETTTENAYRLHNQPAATLRQSFSETGVLINGRDISPAEQMALSRVVGHVEQGNYWLDSAGNFGRVGEGAFSNVRHPNRFGMTSTAAELHVTTLDGRPMP